MHFADRVHDIFPFRRVLHEYGSHKVFLEFLTSWHDRLCSRPMRDIMDAFLRVVPVVRTPFLTSLPLFPV